MHRIYTIFSRSESPAAQPFESPLRNPLNPPCVTPLESPGCVPPLESPRLRPRGPCLLAKHASQMNSNVAE
ncbi:hypothetical protein Lbir_2543 [Legionella birminghamensis]|uniref:Uncharacterized protein n=1 Tax=Legionella birminghamensis TaxID=28083 RepID=A0A378I9E0_9GAMM|nr:hypothetical protein Lbir_2543 [Legionella birminghamensis]STX31350.1 Uncharacterised protein [Legionella birminghamensis]